MTIAAAALGAAASMLFAADAPKPEAPKPPATRPAEAKIPKVDEPRMLEFLRQYELDLYKWVEIVKARDPKKYNEMKKELIKETQDLLLLQARKPKLFELKIEDRRLDFKALQIAKDLRGPTTKPSDTDRLNQELQKVVGQQFEIRQKMRRLELEELQQNLETLRKQLEDQKKQLDSREGRQAEIIKQHIKDLMSPAPRSDW